MYMYNIRVCMCLICCGIVTGADGRFANFYLGLTNTSTSMAAPSVGGPNYDICYHRTGTMYMHDIIRCPGRKVGTSYNSVPKFLLVRKLHVRYTFS